MDFGVAGIDPEPKNGYRTKAQRDRELERFSNAVWQRHSVGAHARSAKRWPNARAFHNHWPEIAFELIVADWKISSVDSSVLDIEIDKLDPHAVSERDWRQLYVDELQQRPELDKLLQREQEAPGDNIELVLERAALTAGERAVVRPALYGLSIADVAHDLSWRVQTTTILLHNALDRLSFFAQTSTTNGHGFDPRGVVGGRAVAAGRSSDISVPAALAASSGADAAP